MALTVHPRHPTGLARGRPELATNPKEGGVDALAAVLVAALAQTTVAPPQTVKLGGSIPADQRLDLFVALDGDDAWSGLAKASDGKGAGPLRTPQAALKRMRELRQQDAKLREKAVLIHLSNGTWYLDAPLAIGPEDSGTPDHPVFLGGGGGMTSASPRPELGTTLSGGRRIANWRATKRGEREVWVADVPDLDGLPWTFHELYVDGTRCPRARHPDHGYLALAGVGDADAAKPWNEGVKALRAASADVALFANPATSADALPADLTLMSRWVESHCRIASVDSASGTMTLRDATVFKPDPGDLFYVESLAALDAPGEWWLDEKTKQLWFVPRPGDALDRTVVVAPHLASLVTIAGGDDAGRRVHDFGIAAVRFEGAQWWFPESGSSETARSSGAVQAAFNVPAALQLTNAQHVTFNTCEVTRCGTYGISLGRGCREVSVNRCWIDDLGAGGVKIGEPSIPTGDAETAANRVVDCTITNLGNLFHSAVGVWIGQSPDNHVERCTIGDLYYTGISIGWTWGYGPAHAGGNVVESNEIHHVGVRVDGDGPILSDMGGIYTLGTQEGTFIRKNFFHDVAAIRYGGWGIYFDEGSTHLEAVDNFVVRTSHGGFHQHYGKENKVHHNLFAFGRDAQLQRSRPEEHSSFTFDHNVIVAVKGEGAGAAKGDELFAGDLRDGHFDFHDNVYELSDAASARFAGKTFAEWQAAGHDAKSIVAPVDLQNEVDADGRQRRPQVWFAPRSSPIWMVLDPKELAGPQLGFVRDRN
jgi:hypothetical protein